MRRSFHNNILISTHTLDGAREQGVGRYLYTSSACVYPEYRQVDTNVEPLREEHAYPAAPPGRVWVGEADHGAPLQTLPRRLRYRDADRPFSNIFRPLGTWDGGREKAPAALCWKVAVAKLTGNRDVEIWGAGEQTRSFCYIHDCVEGIFRLMRSDHHEPLNLGQDRLISINGLADLVSSVAGIAIVEEICSGSTGCSWPELGQLQAARGSRLGAADLPGGGDSPHLSVDRAAGHEHVASLGRALPPAPPHGAGRRSARGGESTEHLQCRERRSDARQRTGPCSDQTREIRIVPSPKDSIPQAAFTQYLRALPNCVVLRNEEGHVWASSTWRRRRFARGRLGIRRTHADSSSRSSCPDYQSLLRERLLV